MRSRYLKTLVTSSKALYSFTLQTHQPISIFTSTPKPIIPPFLSIPTSYSSQSQPPFFSSRHFCSETLTPSNQTSQIDLDKLSDDIIANSEPHCKMETALDEIGVHLTTDSVVQVLHRFRFEEKLAFRFLMWAGGQKRPNYEHEAQAYNEMIDILSSTKYKVKQFRIVCDMLDYMKRHNKTKVPVEVLITILKQYTEKHLNYLHKFAKKKKIRVKC